VATKEPFQIRASDAHPLRTRYVHSNARSRAPLDELTSRFRLIDEADSAICSVDEPFDEPEFYFSGNRYGKLPSVSRQSITKGRSIEPGLKFSSQLARHRDSRIVEGHLMSDHVHLLIETPPKHVDAKVIGYIKAKSAIHIARR